MLVCLPIRFNRFLKSTASKTTLMFTPNIFVENWNDCSIVLNMVVSNLVVVVGPLYNGNRMPELTASYVKIRKRRAKGALRPKKTKKGLSAKAATWATHMMLMNQNPRSKIHNINSLAWTYLKRRSPPWQHQAIGQGGLLASTFLSHWFFSLMIIFSCSTASS